MSATHSLWLPVISVAAGILVHNVALSGLHLLETNLTHQKLADSGLQPILVFAAGAVAGVAAFLTAKYLRNKLAAGAKAPRQGLLDTALMTQLPGHERNPLLVLYGLAAIAFLAAMHTVAHVFWHSFLHDALHWSDLTIIGLSTLLALLLAAYVRRREISESTAEKGEPGAMEAVILFLSDAAGAENDFIHLMAKARFPLDADAVKKTLGLHRWAMPVRSISSLWEQRQLRHIIVIGSTSSWDAIPAFRDGITPAMAGKPIPIHQWPPDHGVDFTDFEELKKAIHSAYAFLAHHQCRRITLDITSGTKLCTIVGLMETLEPGRGTLYVTPDLKVDAYNFDHQAAGLIPLAHEGV